MNEADKIPHRHHVLLDEHYQDDMSFEEMTTERCPYCGRTLEQAEYWIEKKIESTDENCRRCFDGIHVTEIAHAKAVRTAWKYRRAARQSEREKDEAIKQTIDLSKTIKTYLSYSSIDGESERIELRTKMKRLFEQFLSEHKENV